MRTKLRSKVTLLVMALAMLAAGIPAIAFADDISNDLDASIDATAEVMPLTVGDSDGTTQLYVQPRNGDDKNGCNLTGSTTLGLSVSSDNTSVATVSPSSVTFTSCGDLKTLTVHPVAQGTATISVSQTSNNTGGSFNLAPATFTVNVSPPPNSAPTVEVAGVDPGASYNKGSVPAATCEVTDTEDGNSSFPATLSAITGPYASDGIGSQTASCSYTDGGGLGAQAEETYSIVDPSAPVIGYTLNPATPDGNNGWYKGNVTLTWNVSEPQSPNSLQKTGCDDQNITADQAETTYSCSATSAGGSAAQVDVKIKRDGTAPTVVTNGTATGALSNGWYTTEVSQPFRASDALSGLVGLTSPHDFSRESDLAEGGNVSISSGAFSDNAGNSNPGASAGPFQIDLTKPNIVGSIALAPASTGWYNLATGAPTAKFVCSDPDGDNNATNGVGSGVASCEPDHTFPENANPQSKTGNVKDTAGHTNSTTVGPVKVDLSEPTNVNFVGGPAAGGSYDPDSVPAAPTCTADDAISGPPSCVVTGYSANAGTHTLTATATDGAGNVKTATRTYEVKGWSLNGFYHPVDMTITNTAKAGQTVPLKFEMFEAVSGDERTNVSDVKTFTQKVMCGTFTPTEDAIEEYSSGSTSLRHDGSQFIFNWQTPKSGAGSCFRVTMSPNDTSSNAIVANFKLR
jgi:hypothetical protein